MIKRSTSFVFIALVLFYSNQLYSKSLIDVQSWLYQLQDINLEAVAQTDYDLIVMDYSKDGSSENAYAVNEIQTLQNKGQKLVLAYLSIGEAEDYRDYWQPDWEPGDPIWLDQENPDWEGNYKVLYWHDEWQQIILDYLKDIQQAGFDGVYLDLIDAYESYLHFSSVQSWKEMIDFVQMLGDSARVADENFIVIGQNASELIDLDPRYLQVVDGVGQEDLYYGYEGDGLKTSIEMTGEIEFWLDHYKQAEKIVLTVDYPFSQSEDTSHFDSETVVKIKDAYQQSMAKGYIPYCTVRNLNYLTMNPGHNQTYYVDQNHSAANDTNPGTEPLPFKTIQHAIDILQAQEKVLIKEGIYYESLRTSNHGTEVLPIYICNDPDNEVIIDGTNVNTSNTGFRILHDYIYVSGLIFQNWNNGIWIDAAGYTQIDSCTVRDVWFGIAAANGAHHFEINYSEMYRFMLFGFDASPSGGEPCHHGVLNYCTAHTAADPEQNVDGFALGHGDQYNFVFNHCTTYDVFDGFDISSKQTILNGCEAYCCGWGGVKIWQDSVQLNNCIIHNNNVTNIELDWDDTPGSTKLVNCTLYNGGTWNINAYDNPHDQLMMYNCIVAGGDNVGLLLPGLNYQGDYNLFHIDNPPRMMASGDQEFSLQDIESGLWTKTTGQDSHSIVLYCDTVLFLDPENANFHSKANSPAIDNASSIYGTHFDFDGLSRSLFGNPDIGAYEYGGVTNVSASVKSNSSNMHLEANYPNPFNCQTKIRYSIADIGNVHFVITNAMGQSVWKYTIRNQSSGNHHILWNGKTNGGNELSSGIYFIQMFYNRHCRILKMLLVK